MQVDGYKQGRGGRGRRDTRERRTARTLRVKAQSQRDTAADTGPRAMSASRRGMRTRQRCTRACAHRPRAMRHTRYVQSHGDGEGGEAGRGAQRGGVHLVILAVALRVRALVPLGHRHRRGSGRERRQQVVPPTR